MGLGFRVQAYRALNVISGLTEGKRVLGRCPLSFWFVHSLNSTLRSSPCTFVRGTPRKQLVGVQVGLGSLNPQPYRIRVYGQGPLLATCNICPGLSLRRDAACTTAGYPESM